MDQKRQVFSVDLLERYAAKGRGVITCMAVGNDVIVLGTSKGWIIRHDFGVGDSYDIDLSAGRPGEQSIHRVFVDPGGSHCIATIVGAGGADTFYTHAKWMRPRVLGKLKGLVVNAVAWNRQQITEGSTKEVILGTENGQLHEIAVDEKDKREKYIKFLFELKELPESFTGLQMETATVSNGTRYYVMAVTPTRLYFFTGIGSLEEVICSSLKDYNEQIEKLKQEMNDATHGADNIRNDISALAQRYAVIDRDEECGAEYILDLQKQLTLLGNEPRKDANGGLYEEEPITRMAPLDKIRSQLDDAIASECPFCGDLMIREISLPFIRPEEADEMVSWEIKPHNPGSQKCLSLTV